MDEAFNEFLKANTVEESFVDALKLTFDDMYKQMLAMRAGEIDRLKQAIDDLAPRETRLLDLYVGDKGVSKELFQRQIKALEDERVELQDQLASLRIEDINSTEVFAKAKEILCDLYGSWNRLEPIHSLQFLQMRRVFLRCRVARLKLILQCRFHQQTLLNLLLIAQ